MWYTVQWEYQGRPITQRVQCVLGIDEASAIKAIETLESREKKTIIRIKEGCHVDRDGTIRLSWWN